MFKMGKLGLIALAVAVSASAAEYELQRDDGTVGAHVHYVNQGEGVWFGNDFDVATLCARDVRRLRVLSFKGGNHRWDGFRVALFSFDGVPGSIIWPESGVPRFVLPSGSGVHEWVEIDVGWTLPGRATAFVAAQEQYYMEPNNDDYCFDASPTFAGHLWHQTPTRTWYPFDDPYGYVMVRVIVADAAGVRPASLGRVKALYR